MKDLLIKQIIVGEIDTNCFIAADPETLEGVVIDPGEEADRILEAAEKSKISIKHIIATHGHYDHLGAVNELKKRTGADFIINKKDVFFAENPAVNGSAFFGDGTVKAAADKYVSEGDIIKVNGLEFKVINTPGHTPGGICLLSGKHLFSGDTLFNGSIGRTDFPKADQRDMLSSLAKLMELEDDTRVHPGHGEETTIGEERRNNPFLQGLRR